MAAGFQSTKLDVHIGDGCEFMKHHHNEFDLIITDCSDPAGEFCNTAILAIQQDNNAYFLMSSLYGCEYAHSVVEPCTLF